jgi:alanyl-tRNA synthetase
VVAVNAAGREAGLSARDLVRVVAAALGGGGGGKDDIAQGGGTNVAAVGSTLGALPDMVRSAAASA